MGTSSLWDVEKEGGEGVFGMMTRREAARRILEKALSEGRRELLEPEAKEVARAYGVPVPEFGVASSADDATEIAHKIGFPVVAKIVSPDVLHKTDVGGVILNIVDEDGVRASFSTIIDNVRRRAPNARIRGVLISKMVPSDLEVIIGGLRDEQFGPVVMFGLGGVFVEVLRDVSFRVAPVTVDDALEMMTEIKAAKVLRGFRGKPPRDMETLARIIVATADILLENPEIDQIDFNPVMAYEHGAAVVDARMVLRGKQ